MEATPLECRVSSLGQELKRWEQHFATSRHGCKPTRQDIKQDATIASKYSEYHRLRGSLSNNVRKTPSSPHASKRSKASVRESNLMKRLYESTSTPSKDRQIHGTVENSPGQTSDENQIGATGARAFVGPTPQKDGRVLGLFEDLPEVTTPSNASKPKKDESKPVVGMLDIHAVTSTPTRSIPPPKRHIEQEAGLKENFLQMTTKNSRTPQSSGKRFLLDSFVTPSKRRRTIDANTPQSDNKLAHSATPAFLQRTRFQMTIGCDEKNVLSTIAEDDSSSRGPLRRAGTKRKSLARSFSSMIADLRQAEDDRLDEDLEMLRELEEETMENGQPKTLQSSHGNVLVEDSQAANILGPDGVGALSEDEEDTIQNLGKDGRPLRIWKKKGQKRQTRRVNMRPTGKAKIPKPAMGQFDDDSVDESGQGKEEIRRRNVGASVGTNAQLDGKSDENDQIASESDSEDELRDHKRPVENRKTRNGNVLALANQVTTNAAEGEEQTTKKSDNIVHKTVKKISATAHANFRRLKIRSSKGAKATGKGKFGRGRR